jgi:hypothetical protein
MTTQASQSSELPELPYTNYNGCSDGSEPLYTADQMRDYARKAIAAQTAQAVPVGWKLVPTEPTPAMRMAAADAWLDCGSKMILNKAASALTAGIAAAPDFMEVK